LSVRDLSTSFETDRGTLIAVNGVSFDVKRGETLGVVGESGSGKTVLSRSIMNLLPPRGLSQSGSVIFDGNEMVGAEASVMRTLWGVKIAMIFQDPMSSLNPVVRIGRQITETLRLHLNMDRAEAKKTAIALLGQVGIPSPEKRISAYPHQLSGGMRQRVMIAIALACGPRLILADEPTTSLDVTVQAQILDLLASMQEERNMSVILVSHDLGVVATRTDKIAVMYGGRIVEIAPTRSLFTSMAMPYTQALIGSTPRLSQPSHSRLTAIDGRPPDLVNLPAGCAFAPRCAFATERCLTEVPSLEAHPSNPDHLFACWNPLSTGPISISTPPTSQAAP
jgi:peptide/nickel transport system ATP-binding protein